MSGEHVLYEKKDGVGIITLNRPGKLNTITHPMLRRLGELIEEIKKDDSVRVMILTGKGRAFSAGTDISGEVPIMSEIEIQVMKQKDSTEYRQSLWYFNSIPKPTICAINGAAVGIASEFALHCDIRIAAESARFGQVFVLRGMTPDLGAGTYLLPRIVGLSKACELVFSGEIIDAQEMLRIGLVSQVVPDDQLMTAAMAMAKRCSEVHLWQCRCQSSSCTWAWSVPWKRIGRQHVMPSSLAAKPRISWKASARFLKKESRTGKANSLQLKYSTACDTIGADAPIYPRRIEHQSSCLAFKFVYILSMPLMKLSVIM